MRPEDASKLLNRVEEHLQRFPERLRNDLKEAVQQLRDRVATLRGGEQIDVQDTERLKSERAQNQYRVDSSPPSSRDSIYNHGYQAPDHQEGDFQRPGPSRGATPFVRQEREDYDRDR